MTIWSEGDGRSLLRRRTALAALCVAVPLLGLGYQVAARYTAVAMAGVPFGPAWLLGALLQPWGVILLLCEGLGLMAWMTALSEIKLSVAVPLSALSYVLVVSFGWIVLHERFDPVQLLGAVAILGGVWLVGRSRS